MVSPTTIFFFCPQIRLKRNFPLIRLYPVLFQRPNHLAILPVPQQIRHNWVTSTARAFPVKLCSVARNNRASRTFFSLVVSVTGFRYVEHKSVMLVLVPLMWKPVIPNFHTRWHSAHKSNFPFRLTAVAFLKFLLFCLLPRCFCFAFPLFLWQFFQEINEYRGKSANTSSTGIPTKSTSAPYPTIFDHTELLRSLTGFSVGAEDDVTVAEEPVRDVPRSVFSR